MLKIKETANNYSRIRSWEMQGDELAQLLQKVTGETSELVDWVSDLEYWILDQVLRQVIARHHFDVPQSVLIAEAHRLSNDYKRSLFIPLEALTLLELNKFAWIVNRWLLDFLEGYTFRIGLTQFIDSMRVLLWNREQMNRMYLWLSESNWLFLKNTGFLGEISYNSKWGIVDIDTILLKIQIALNLVFETSSAILRGALNRILLNFNPLNRDVVIDNSDIQSISSKIKKLKNDGLLEQ